MPGSALALMRGLLDRKRAAPLVFVQTLSDKLGLVQIQPNFRNILQGENLGIDQQEIDPDFVSRRFAEKVKTTDGEVVPTLAGQILRRIGVPVRPGYIDYSLGAPLDYV